MPLPPTDRLRGEAGARALGALASDWLERTALDAQATAKLLETRRSLLAAIAPSHPRDANACVACEMLPFVAPSIERLHQPLADLMRGPLQLPFRLQKLEHDIAAARDATTILQHYPDPLQARRDWLRCLLSHANLPEASRANRDEVLRALEQPPASPTQPHAPGAVGAPA
jgi:hypothetical protein